MILACSWPNLTRFGAVCPRRWTTHLVSQRKSLQIRSYSSKLLGTRFLRGSTTWSMALRIIKLTIYPDTEALLTQHLESSPDVHLSLL